MILDCEYVHATRTFVVFDVFSVRGRMLTEEYRHRLRVLAGLQLPVLAGELNMRPKTVYPLCALTLEWYTGLCDAEPHIDGIIVHNGGSVLGAPSTMYKWKPVHTVDLYVGPDGTMMDGKYTEFRPLEPDHGMKLTTGDIWECVFAQDGASVRPVRRRVDKPRANARHVCREILKAHCDNLSVSDARCILNVPSNVIRQSKRKR